MRPREPGGHPCRPSSACSSRRFDRSRRYGPRMTIVDEQGRPEPPVDGDEAATLLGFLDYQRATLEWKCAGLDAAGLAATVGVSPMSLGGLLKHLAYVDEWWSCRVLHDRELGAPWSAVDWAADA